MTEEDLNRLEALAKAATSGPWARHSDPQAYAVYQPEFECWIPQDGNDADFIAASNPNAILSLIRLARIGLAARQGTIGHMDNGKTALTAAVLQVSALPKPGGGA